MSLTLLAAAAVGFVAPYLAELTKSAVGEAGSEAAKGVVEWMRGRLGGRTKAALEALEAAPQSEGKKTILQGEILAALEDEPKLADELQDLLQKAGVQAVQSMTISGRGAAGAQVAGNGNSVNVRGDGGSGG